MILPHLHPDIIKSILQSNIYGTDFNPSNIIYRWLLLNGPEMIFINKIIQIFMKKYLINYIKLIKTINNINDVTIIIVYSIYKIREIRRILQCYIFYKITFRQRILVYNECVCNISESDNEINIGDSCENCDMIHIQDNLLYFKNNSFINILKRM